MSSLVVDGLRLAVRIGGDGPPILLLHGFTGRGSDWARFLPALRRRHRTIVVDLPGHGRSGTPPDPARHGLERTAADLAALLRTLDAVPAAVLGYSMGARVALRLALDHPLVVERLVLESPSAGIADPAERARRRVRDEALGRLVEQDGISAFVDAWEAQPLFASQAGLSPAVRADLRRRRLGNRPAGLAASLRWAGQGTMTPLHERLGEIRVPALVIAGGLDPAGLARAAAIAAAIHGARLATVDEAGHAPHLERPEAFRRLIVGFLDGAPGSNASPAPARAPAPVPASALAPIPAAAPASPAPKRRRPQ